jgi:hypothetical protein
MSIKEEEVLKDFQDELQRNQNQLIVYEYDETKDYVNFLQHRLDFIEDEINEINSDNKEDDKIIEMYSGDPFKDALNREIQDEKERKLIEMQIEVVRPILKVMSKNNIKSAEFRKEKANARKLKLENEKIELKNRLRKQKLRFKVIKENYDIETIKKELGIEYRMYL